MQVVKGHTESFAETPFAEKGELVAFLGLDPKNAAWFRGRDSRGVAGYFPVGWFEIDRRAGSAVALRDYDACELSVRAGDELEIVERYGGWRLARLSEGLGWVPAECFGEKD